VEILLAALGAVLTLLIFSYLLGDNPLYRLALHIFVGASVAYAFVIALRGVILPALERPDTSDPGIRSLWIISLVGVLLGALLLMRGVRGLAWLSEISVAILLGVGVGVALAGALLGTLVPQLDAATAPVVPEALKPLGQVIAVVGTITGLMVFSFTGRRPTRRLMNRLLNGGARVGYWFILIGFGAAYGGVLVASLSFFADRVQYLIEVLEKISGG
jgi:amino acid transporter